MKKRWIMLLLPVMVQTQAQTLDECQQAAVRNYPLINQYELVEKTTQLTVDNLQKGWLPQISAQAQATWQSDVMSWPNEMQAMMSQMGISLAGLKKDQYRVGIDISQTLYDGGAIKGQKAVARQQGTVERAQTDVSLYQVRKRVNEMYFALLLIDDQLQLNRDLQQLLAQNEQQLATMHKNGTAAESDYLSMKAERLNAIQQQTTLESQQQMLSNMLGVFCGIEIKKVEKPAMPTEVLSQQAQNRPELRLIDEQLRLTDTREQALNAALLPRLSIFASGFYGYPGYNMFDDMLNHKWSLNGMVGARLSWTIGALYTRKTDKARLAAQRSLLGVQRDVFLFNNRLEQMQENEHIARYRRLMADDNEIISLRTSVRKAAESKLKHGTINVNDLVKELNNENAARRQRSTHEVEMLKHVYDLRYADGQ